MGEWVLDGFLQCGPGSANALTSCWRGYPPTQTWRTFLRNQAFGIGTLGLGEAGRLSDKLLALVRGWIARVVRCVTKVRDGFRCRLILQSLRRLRPYRSSNRTARRDPRSGCMPVPRPPTTLGPRRQLDYSRSTTFTVSLEGITDMQAAGITNFARPAAVARASGPQFLQRDCTARLPRTIVQKANDPQYPSPTRRPFCESTLTDKFMRCYGLASVSLWMATPTAKPASTDKEPIARHAATTR
jgi:hypothetical protein